MTGSKVFGLLHTTNSEHEASWKPYTGHQGTTPVNFPIPKSVNTDTSYTYLDVDEVVGEFGAVAMKYNG